MSSLWTHINQEFTPKPLSSFWGPPLLDASEEITLNTILSNDEVTDQIELTFVSFDLKNTERNTGNVNISNKLRKNQSIILGRSYLSSK